MAMEVMVVSRQLDRVLVAQNHCQGLQMDKASYRREQQEEKVRPNRRRGEGMAGTWSVQQQGQDGCHDRRLFRRVSMYSRRARLRRRPG